MTKFLTITVSPTDEALMAAWKKAGGAVNERRPVEDEMRALRRRMTVRQRVHVGSVTEWIAQMWAQGLRVENVAVAVPPIA